MLPRDVAMNRELFEKAKAVREHAHAPYSKFHVGAAIRSEAGAVHAGTNVENASYPEGSCAETAAIAAMVAASTVGPGRRIAEVTVVADRIEGRLTTPCGGCRQRLAEFSGPATPVHVIDPSGSGKTFRMDELLPAAFAMDETLT
jgi:cytidine deaminase